MIHLDLKDNLQKGRDLSKVFVENGILENSEEFKDLMNSLVYLEHKSLRELLKPDNKNLFVLANEDKIEDEHIFHLNSCEYNNCIIQTGNIVGFVGYNNLQINITSRFANAKEDYFLHYMLSRVFNINLSELEHEYNKDSFFDFLIFLFPFYLRRAFSKGIYRQYTNHYYDDSNIKGSVNISRFIKNDVPFIGNISYSKREYTSDNKLTELVRHTIEFIKACRFRSILKDSTTSVYVNEIINATQNYRKDQRESIILKNMKPVQHPYYSEWTDLQKICLMILRHQKIKYASNKKHNIYGILIDISWLWEEYLNSILVHADIEGYTHPQNKKSKGRIYLFENQDGVRYPDFYSKKYVFDAKYKRFDRFEKISEVDRNDMHQMISYIHILSSFEDDSLKNGLFLYPTGREDNIFIASQKLCGMGGEIGALGLNISKESSFKTFMKEMRDNEKSFVDRIRLYS